MAYRSAERTRRRVLAALAGTTLATLAGCSGGDGAGEDTPTGRATGGDGTPTSAGGSDGAVDVDGLERVAVADGNITVRRTEESPVTGVRLYGPEDEQLGGTVSFNNIQREINYSLASGVNSNAESWPSGTYTLEAIGEGGEQIGTDALTLTRSFAVVDASVGSRTGDGTFVVFEVENTGDLPVGFDRVRVLESTSVAGYVALGDGEEEGVVMSEEYRGSAIRPGRTGTVRGRVEFTYVNREFEEGGKEAFETPSIPPCDDWEVTRTYELVGAAGGSATVQVRLRVGGEAENVRRIAYECSEVTLLEFDAAGD